MKNHFDWQTEERGQHEEPELPQISSSARPRWPGYWFFLLLIAASILSIVVWIVKDTQSDADNRVREEIFRAFELQQQAVEKNDKELYVTMISSTDPGWKFDQELLFANNLINDRSALGLIAGSQPPTVESLELSPNLQEAKLSFMQDFIIFDDSKEISEIDLLSYQSFRLEENRWMRAPMDPDFWGPSHKVDGKYVEITYPEQDAEFMSSMVEIIDTYLESLCRNVEEKNPYGQAVCAGELPLQINLRTDDGSLLNFTDKAAVRSSNFDFELSAPSLIGVPVNGKDWNAYFDLYLASTFQEIKGILQPTTSLPDQSLYALCFNHPVNGMKLYQFDWRFRSWKPLLTEQSFNHLNVTPDDSRIMLVKEDTIILANMTDRISGSNINLSDHEKVRQEVIPTLSSYGLLEWVATADVPYFLLMSFPRGNDPARYEALDILTCDKEYCNSEELPGFPVPSVHSEATLFVDGSNIFLRTGNAGTYRLVGEGFNPFWVDGETFGFVRFEGDTNTGITTQIVLRNSSDSDVQVLVDGHDLARLAGISANSSLYIHDVISNPVDANKLLIVSTGVREYSGVYFIFSIDVTTRLLENPKMGLKLEMSRRGSLTGVIGLLSPTGFPLVQISPNGRWVAMIELNSQDRDTWTILIHDLFSGKTNEISKEVPAVPGNIPLLDWSGDGRWLMVANHDYLQLIAPENGYEDHIAHDFDACSRIVWAD